MTTRRPVTVCFNNAALPISHYAILTRFLEPVKLALCASLVCDQVPHMETWHSRHVNLLNANNPQELVSLCRFYDIMPLLAEMTDPCDR